MIPETPEISLGINLLHKLSDVKLLRCEISDKGREIANDILKTNKKYKWFKLNSYPIKIINKIPQLKREVTYLKSGTGKSHTKAKLVRKLTPKLAYLLGALRDGSLIQSSGMHWVRIYDKLESNWIDNVIIKLFKDVYNVDFKIRKTKSEKYCDISNKPLLYQLKIIVKNLHKDVPQIIKKCKFDIVKYYISGFFDAEGYVSKSKNLIIISQNNKESLNFIKNILEINEIKCGKVFGKQLPIYNKGNIQDFYDKIGTSYDSKINRFVNLLGT